MSIGKLRDLNHTVIYTVSRRQLNITTLKNSLRINIYQKNECYQDPSIVEGKPSPQSVILSYIHD